MEARFATIEARLTAQDARIAQLGQDIAQVSRDITQVLALLLAQNRTDPTLSAGLAPAAP